MRFKYSILFLILLTASLFYSCSGSDTGKEPDKIPVKQIKERVNYNSNLIRSLEASGTIAFESAEQSNQGSIDIKIKKPDSVMVEIDGPFGISIVKALIARDSFIYYNVQDNHVIRGPSSEINIGAIMRIRLSFDELINSLSGSFSFKDENMDTLEASTEGIYYLLTTGGNDRQLKYYIESSSFLIDRYNIIGSQNTLLLDVEYSKYSHETVDNLDIYFPNQIIISRPDKKQKIWLYYTSTDINKQGISFKLKVPRSAKESYWK